MAPKKARNNKGRDEEPTLAKIRRAELAKNLKGICDVVSNLIKEQKNKGDDDNIDAKWFTKFKRLNPPEFKSTTDRNEAIAWLKRIEKFFRAMRCPNHMRVDLQYYPGFSRKAKENEFLNLKQNGMSVIQYAAKFVELSHFPREYVGVEEKRAQRFEEGLSWNIRDKLADSIFTTDEEKAKSYSGNFTKRHSSGSSNQPNSWKARQENCEHCGGKHPTHMCYHKNGTYFKCGKTGHRVAECQEPGVNTGFREKSEYKRVFPHKVDHKDEGKSANHSFMTLVIAGKIGYVSKSLDYDLCLSTPLGISVMVDRVFKNYAIRIDNYDFPANLFELDMDDFDVILGMDWLATYHAFVDCHKKRVVFSMPDMEEIVYLGSDVFPDDILGLPLDREVEFSIDLEPGTGPIFKAPYRMAPGE
ncbi:hypothetical protein LIER_43525 [Lithospermum erythrorhizon]|uniref:CCHC-type domain-containing protein n=1 Tax=Lithospermum erythrorhizon TaxID=34254 RepID=A0AAV3QD26_LITER